MTASARHWIHIDSDGLGTFVDVQCGGKWWILFGPADGETKDAFGFIDQFLNDFDTRSERADEWGSTSEGLWLAEAVYLSPGTRL